eukprot:m.15865 g.15865  ORF g.15865 m.15865 type:complete len:265 (+) comp3077_c0_seq1:23-817(+)
MVSKGPFIQNRITRQLLEVLGKYFPEDEALISSLHWPRCFRNFVIEVVTDIGNSLQDKLPSDFNMEECLKEMQLPTSHSITLANRHSIHKFLQAALIYTSETPLYVGRKPPEYNCEPVTVWPPDIIHVDDLIQHVGRSSLRDDIKKYIFYVQDQVRVQLCINFNIKADKPIVIKTPTDEETVRVRVFLEAVAVGEGMANLAPLDVIEVRTRVGLLAMLGVADEAYPGTSIKKGTIGGESRIIDDVTPMDGINMASRPRTPCKDS